MAPPRSIRAVALTRACALLLAVGALAAPARAATTSPPVAQPPVALPPDLLAFEHQLAALKIASMRFSFALTVSEAGSKRASGPLSKLFGAGGTVFGLAGEVREAPPASNLTLTLFGHPLTFRTVAGRSYAYIPQITRIDGGRPWLALGAHGLGELFGGTSNGSSSRGSRGSTRSPMPFAIPTLGGAHVFSPSSFVKFNQLLAGARSVTELGAGVADAQPVTRFFAVLNPSELEPKQSAASLRRGRALERRLHIHLHPRPVKRTATLEIDFAADGVPVHLVLAEHERASTTLVTLDIPAVNFALAIAAPPAAKTVTQRQLKQLALRVRKRRRAHKRAK